MKLPDKISSWLSGGRISMKEAQAGLQPYPPAGSPNPAACMCWHWLDENRIAHGLTTERFPDDHILGRFHYVDCPLQLGPAYSGSVA